jgi:acid phosphatase (class A)
MLRPALAAVALALSVTGSALAQVPATATFIASADVDLKAALPPWPAPGSLAEAADIETLLAVQLRRSAADAADAQADSVTTMPQWTAQLLGMGADKLPRTFALMAALHDDMRRINRAANEAQGFRTRPAQYDSRVKPSLDLIGHGNASYPSARASSGAVWAGVVNLLVPEQAAAANAIAERIAWRRVVGGVHYPSDLAGSRKVAAAVLSRLQERPSFRAALAQACEELTSAMVTAGCKGRLGAPPSGLSTH